MVAASFAPLGQPRRSTIGLVLAVAACQRLLVAGYLMHLVSEKKIIHDRARVHRVLLHRP